MQSLRLLLLVAALMVGPVALAQALETPKTQVILTIGGAVGNTNAEIDGRKVARLDREMLNALPQRAFRTTTPWHNGRPEFSGPMLRDVLALVGAQGRELRVVAINDYASTVPVADGAFDVVLATLIDGAPIPVREKGPLFIVYNFDGQPRLRTEQYFSRSVWQVKSIEVLP
jgi:hypothetical protein